jgi:hypothetical protein
VRWLQEQDFNGPWGSLDAVALMDFQSQRGLPELTFNDPELEARRKAFAVANETWLTKLVNYSSHIDGNTVRVKPSVYEGGPDSANERWAREAAELNELADVVVEAYDALIEAGRARGFDVLDVDEA